ncbi:MAG: VOC family protein [Thermomicrobiales bacterium]
MNDAVRPAAPLLANVSHIALVTPDLARLSTFYVDIFGGAVASSTGRPAWKCTIQLTASTALHLYEVPAEHARTRGDLPYDEGSINHFALEAASPEAFLTIRERLMAGGYTDSAVMAAPYGYSINAVDPDGLYIEITLARPPGWEPPFHVTAFMPLPADRV